MIDNFASHKLNYALQLVT